MKRKIKMKKRIIAFLLATVSFNIFAGSTMDVFCPQKITCKHTICTGMKGFVFIDDQTGPGSDGTYYFTGGLLNGHNPAQAICNYSLPDNSNQISIAFNDSSLNADYHYPQNLWTSTPNSYYSNCNTSIPGECPFLRIE
jgi:hypothetical protein